MVAPKNTLPETCDSVAEAASNEDLSPDSVDVNVDCKEDSYSIEDSVSDEDSDSDEDLDKDEDSDTDEDSESDGGSDCDEVDDAGCFALPSNRRGFMRNRQTSLSESEDSFVVFESEVVQGQCDLVKISDDGTEESESEEKCLSHYASSSSVILTKKVRFATVSVVHQMITWSFAYQAARKGHWEQFARDNERFKMRINNVEPELSKVLQPEHRNKVYTERFNKHPNLDVHLDV